jgi:hypothetical protein
VKYLQIYVDLLLNEKKRNSKRKLIDTQLFIKNKFSNLYRFFFDKKYRDWKMNKEFMIKIGNMKS